MKDTIKGAAKKVGLAPETLRKYEKYGVVKPDTNDETGYRYFDIHDLSRLYSCKRLRQCGFGLEETVSLLNDTPQKLMTALSVQSTKIKDNIHRQQILLESMKKMREDMENAVWRTGNFSIIENYETEFYYSTTMQNKDDETDTYRVLSDLMPISRLTNRIHFHENEWKMQDSGFILTAEALKISGLQRKNATALLLPGQRVISSFITDTSCKNTDNIIHDALLFASKNHCILSGTCYSDTIFCTGINDKLLAYKNIVFSVDD